MQLKLSDKIKQYRKEMELTQEGLSEAIGVTVGAVSKWENGNTVPDIMTLMQLANFFNISMDELLGFDLTSKNVDDMCDTIEKLARLHEFEQALVEARNAISRYPHNFKVLYATANLYYYKYLSVQDKNAAESAIEYFSVAMDHISQNLDPEIGEYSIKSKIAYLYRESDPEKAIELLKQINYDGHNCNAIALILADLGKTDESLEYFTNALLITFSDLLNTVFNISSVLSVSGKKADAAKAIEMVDAELAFIKASSADDKVNFTYKMRSALLIIKACLYSRLENTDEMKKSIEEAYKMAYAFDNSDAAVELIGSIKFLFSPLTPQTHDATGTEAIAGIDNILEYKISASSPSQKKIIKRVHDYWNEAKNSD